MVEILTKKPANLGDFAAQKRRHFAVPLLFAPLSSSPARFPPPVESNRATVGGKSSFRPCVCGEGADHLQGGGGKDPHPTTRVPVQPKGQLRGEGSGDKVGEQRNWGDLCLRTTKSGFFLRPPVGSPHPCSLARDPPREGGRQIPQSWAV